MLDLLCPALVMDRRRDLPDRAVRKAFSGVAIISLALRSCPIRAVH